MSREDSQTIRSLTDDRNIVMKKEDKGSGVVVWNRSDYLLEAEKQLSDTKVYRDVSNTIYIISKFSEASNEMFSSLKKRGFLTVREMRYFNFEFKKATNFGKLYLLPKIRKRLHNMP